jgi:hypothetical protein
VNRRTLLVSAGWLGAAVLAVLVGLGAIGMIGAGLTAPQTRPLSAAEVADQLARQQSAPPASAATGARTAPSASTSDLPPAQTFRTRGGTVVGRCAGTRPEIVSMSPVPGFELHEQDRGLQDDDAEGEFRAQGGGGKDRVKFEIVCRAGIPALLADD